MDKGFPERTEGHSPKRSVDPARVRRLAEDGATIREICEELGVGYSTVKYWMVKLGLTTERTRRIRQFREAKEQGSSTCRRSAESTA